MSSDNEIVEQSRVRPAVFADLYERHHQTVFRYAARRVGEHPADDVMSETFLVAFERRHEFDAIDALPWLLGIATVLLRKHARLEARAWKGVIAGGQAYLDVDEIGAADSRVDAERAVARLAKTLRKLPAGDRDALLLYAWGDLDYEAVAEALHIPVGTVRSRLNRARRKLRAAIGTYDTEEMDDGRVGNTARGTQ